MSRHLRVQGAPFFVLGGQVHNSTTYTPQALERACVILHRLGANTAEIPIYWECIEPVEGIYDFSSCATAIQVARSHGLRLIVLWFGTWKNGTMKYAPAWVKQQPDRFWRVITAEGHALPVLSPFCAATQQADQSAFCALLAHLKAVDAEQGTVIAVQVENEPGSMGAERDFSSVAESAFAAAVPDELSAVLPALTRPEVRAAWQQAGGLSSGSWSALFGEAADEVFSAWYTARYIDNIAAAGKEIYAIPHYVNVWLGLWGFRAAGYTHPAGGAVSAMLDIWKAAAPHLDMLSPDIYHRETTTFLQTCADYDRMDNPLFIPECGAWQPTSWQMFAAIAQHNAIGIAPFGIESMVDEAGNWQEHALALVDSFAVVRAMLPLIVRYQGTGRLHAVMQEEGADSQYIALEGYAAFVQFGVGRYGRPLPERPGQAGRGRGFLVQAGPGEFYAAGVGFTAFIRPPNSRVPRGLRGDPRQGRFDPWLTVEVGHFEGETWIVDDHRSGDESDFGLMVLRPEQVVRGVYDVTWRPA